MGPRRRILILTSVASVMTSGLISWFRSKPAKIMDVLRAGKPTFPKRSVSKVLELNQLPFCLIFRTAAIVA